MKNIEVLDIFIPAYLECALWSSTTDDGEPLDTLYDFRTKYDFRTNASSEMCLRVVEDCTQFLMRAKPYLCEGVDLSQVGHDFWLTRNRHGAGFWDRPEIYDGAKKDLFSVWYRWYRENRNELPSQHLTEIAQSFGEIDIYVGDDGKLYFG